MDDEDNMKNTAFITGSSLLLGFATPCMSMINFLYVNDPGYRQEMEQVKCELLNLLDSYEKKCLHERMSLIFEVTVTSGEQGDFKLSNLLDLWRKSDDDDKMTKFGSYGTDHWEGWRMNNSVVHPIFKNYKEQVRILYQDKFGVVKHMVNEI